MASGKGGQKSMIVTQSAMCAVLYALGAYLTAYIESPWGSGQFRPAVVIPAVFATFFGPLVGGIGAAIGTLIADSVAHGQIYIRSLVSAVPGNFVGFYLFGWLLKKKFSWKNFIYASQITLITSNVIVAFLYVYFRTFVDASYPAVFRDSWVYVSLGLVAWWYVTMLPFMLIVGPLLIRAVSAALPGLIPEQAKFSSMKAELPRLTLTLSLILPSLVMLAIGASLVLASPAQLLASKFAPNALILTGMQIMFLGSGVILLALGVLILAAGRHNLIPR